MKIRTGFVSNSSSSSFVCEICGAADGGMDICLSDIGMVECENEHIMCERHVENYVSSKGLIDEYNDSQPDKEGYWSSSCIDKRFCPICNLAQLGDDDILRFLCKRGGLSRKEITEVMAEQFDGDYDTFIKYLKD